MGYEEEGEQMGEFVEGIVFGVKSGFDLRSQWIKFKSTNSWKLNKNETLNLIDNFIDVYQGYKVSDELELLREQIKKE